jgi:hypothetical protein
MSEAQIQQECIVWFRNKYCRKDNGTRYAMFSVPNEAGYKNKQFVSTGMLPGVSDTIVVLNGKVLFIEFKTATGKQSERQKDFEETVKALGHPYFICRNFKDFVFIIEKHL